MGRLRARTWLIGLCPVWDPIGNENDTVRLPFMVPKSLEAVSEKMCCGFKTTVHGLSACSLGLKDTVRVRAP